MRSLVPRFIFSPSLFQTICQLWMTIRLQVDLACSLFHIGCEFWIYSNRSWNEGVGRDRNQEVLWMHPLKAAAQRRRTCDYTWSTTSSHPWGGRCPQNQTPTLKVEMSKIFMRICWWVIIRFRRVGVFDFGTGRVVTKFWRQKAHMGQFVQGGKNGRLMSYFF